MRFNKIRKTFWIMLQRDKEIHSEQLHLTI